MAKTDVFVDTSGFFALWDAGDAHHAAARRLQRKLVAQNRRFLITDYVMDETVTLLRMRHSHSAAVDFLGTVERSASVQVEWMNSEQFSDAGDLFRQHADKEWSFTDCVSFCVMRNRRIREAFTTDPHFRQAGFDHLLSA